MHYFIAIRAWGGYSDNGDIKSAHIIVQIKCPPDAWLFNLNLYLYNLSPRKANLRGHKDNAENYYI